MGKEGEEEKEDEDEEEEEEEEEEKEQVLVWGDAAPSLTEGMCGTMNCTECRESWFDGDASSKEYRCKDETEYRYTNMCNNNKRKKNDLCMTGDEFCHWSYPAGDPKKWKSEDAACRSIP